MFFLYQLLTYFYLKHIFSWPLYIFVTYLSEKYISYITVLARGVLFGYPSKCYFEHCIKKIWKMVSLISVKYPLFFFFFNLPEPRVQGSFFLNTFCLTPVLLFVWQCPSSNVFLSDFLSRTISNFNQIWQSIDEEL